jgi:hypothetical protein
MHNACTTPAAAASVADAACKLIEDLQLAVESERRLLEEQGLEAQVVDVLLFCSTPTRSEAVSEGTDAACVVA